jgi:methyl-accepting chemotaxis protein
MMKNLKIRMKILLGFAIVVIGLVAIGLFSLQQMKRINEKTQDISSMWMPTIYYVSNMNLVHAFARVKTYKYFTTSTVAGKKDVEKEIFKALKDYDNIAGIYEKTLLSGDEQRKLYEATKVCHAKYVEEVGKLIKYSQEKKNDKAAQILHGDSYKYYLDWTAALSKLSDYSKAHGDKSSVEAAKTYANSEILIISFIILIVIVCLVIGLYIANIISKGVKKMDKAAKSLAIGNMDVDLFVDSKDEVGSLGKSFQDMKDSLGEIIEKAKLVASGDLTVSLNKRSEKDDLIQALNDMVTKVSEVIYGFQSSSEKIAQVSFEISAGAQQLSQGASEQASAAEQISSSMEEMLSNIQQNADNSQQTEKIAIMAAENIKQGNTATAKSSQAMKDIAGKISIISEISFQTNILALNAAVEAARAGDLGRGFAVVAAEVRKLAERSKVAADEINRVSKDGVEIAKLAGRQLDEIVPEIQKTSRLVQEISAACVEQNSGSEQINNAIQQLNQVTQQNASSSEELATTSEELSIQSQQLLDLISFFKLADVKQDNRNKWEHQTPLKSKVTDQFPKRNFSKGLIKQEENRGVRLKLTSKESDTRDDAFEKY